MNKKKLWAGIAVLALLAPLGLIVPYVFHAGGAWGEWGTETLEKLLGFLPEGLKKMAGLWRAPIPDYSPGPESASLPAQSGYYVLSAFIGVALVAGIMYVVSRVLIRKK